MTWTVTIDGEPLARELTAPWGSLGPAQVAARAAAHAAAGGYVAVFDAVRGIRREFIVQPALDGRPRIRPVDAAGAAPGPQY